MNPEIKERWCAALEDPNARQGMGWLTTNEGDCCLGVLCKIAVEDGIASVCFAPGDEEIGKITYFDPNNPHDANKSVLPIVVMFWAGLTEGHPEVKSRGLATWNDGGSSFREIAEMIREEL